MRQQAPDTVATWDREAGPQGLTLRLCLGQPPGFGARHPMRAQIPFVLAQVRWVRCARSHALLLPEVVDPRRHFLSTFLATSKPLPIARRLPATRPTSISMVGCGGWEGG
jgi:hypothetical protein